MRVIVISETIQEFDGVRYYLCGPYFQSKGVRLHRRVWEFHHGTIPKDHHVHHNTEDQSRNQIEDLELKLGVDHNRDHSVEHGMASEITALGQEAAKEWHGSDAGAEWHSKHYEASLREKMNEPTFLSCRACGNAYGTTANNEKRSKFCGNTCKARAFRAANPNYHRRYA